MPQDNRKDDNKLKSNDFAKEVTKLCLNKNSDYILQGKITNIITLSI